MKMAIINKNRNKMNHSQCFHVRHGSQVFYNLISLEGHLNRLKLR